MRLQDLRQPRSSAGARLGARHLGRRPRNLQPLDAHGRQDLKGECETELALIHPIDEHLNVDVRALGLKQPGKVLVGDLPVDPGGLDEGLRRAGVEIPATGTSGQIVFHLQASYRPAIARRPINGIQFMHKTSGSTGLDEERGICLGFPGNLL